jgi:hypothetical protein
MVPQFKAEADEAQSLVLVSFKIARIVHRLRIRECFYQLRIDQHHIGSLTIPVYVFAAHATGKIVFSAHFGDTAFGRCCLDICVFHSLLPAAR